MERMKTFDHYNSGAFEIAILWKKNSILNKIIENGSLRIVFLKL